VTWLAVVGNICIRPRAPADDAAPASNRLSCNAIA